ncbi:MAG: PEP-CTERM sorting domain-containing protein [Sedimentisphaerales bacterium]|nr:PEP-CTERM sorting domain-containing protein [Sedimentisphaerales bacterium]
MKEIRFLSLLLFAALFVQNAAAALYLPYSSYYQGRSYFDSNGVTGFVEFAVYDTQYYNEWEGGGFGSPGSGRYIYAYQVFNYTSSADAIGSFTIMGSDDPNTAHTLIGINTISSQNPWEDSPLMESVEPTGTDVNPGQTRATWEFWGETEAILYAGEYSWFLIFSSNNPWVLGKYQVGTATNGVPVTTNPEPCTVALLGLGSAILFTKRRKSIVRSHY